MGAGVAFAAVHLGFNGHPLTHLELGDSLPQRRDLAGDLVALGDRVLGVGVLAVVYVDVGAADADALDFHQHLPGPAVGTGTLSNRISLGAVITSCSMVSYIILTLLCLVPSGVQGGRTGKSIYIMRVWEGKVKRIFVKNAQNIR